MAAALAAAPVQASCWSSQDAAAAQVRNLQSMLMVAALRCQVIGYPIDGDYNSFVASSRQTIQAMNDLLKRHFARETGPLQGQRDYDSFTTRLANMYGGAHASAEDCSTAGVIARDARMMDGSIDGLLLIAERAGIQTDMPGGMCTPVTFAQADYPRR